MSSYYGVTRSSEYLAHYGIRGMKWGVRKALAKGNMKRLADYYQRSLIKNADLKEKTSKRGQKDLAKSRAIGGATLLGAGAIGGLASKKTKNGALAGYSAIAGLGGLAALGSSAASAYRTTNRGNKRAVAKYNRFNSEMKKTFTKQMRKKINNYIQKNPEYDWFDGRRFKRG